MIFLLQFPHMISQFDISQFFPHHSAMLSRYESLVKFLYDFPVWYFETISLYTRSFPTCFPPWLPYSLCNFPIYNFLYSIWFLYTISIYDFSSAIPIHGLTVWFTYLMFLQICHTTLHVFLVHVWFPCEFPIRLSYTTFLYDIPMRYFNTMFP